MNKSNKSYAALAAAVLLLAAALGAWLWTAPEWEELQMGVNVANHVGFDVNKTALMFGSAMPGSTLSREFKIENTADYDKFAEFRIEGPIRDMVTVEPNAIAKAGRNTSIAVSVKIPADAKYGGYAGTMRIFLRRAI